VHRIVVPLLLALAASCEHGSSSSAAALAAPDPAARASVAGVVVETPAAPLRQVTGLAVVGSLADAPAGSVPLAGAEVKVLGRPGSTLEATGATGADGSFRIEGLEITHAILEVRRDPATSADLVMLLTLVRGETVVAGARYAVDRNAAIDLAMPRVPASAGVVCSQNPLPAGTMVFATLGNANGEAPTIEDTHVVAEGDEWLLYVDAQPDAPFEHDVSYLFVHAQTGEVTEQPATSWPSLNFISIWSSDADLVSLGDFHPVELLETGQFPADAEVALSDDIVTWPAPSDPPEPELTALAQAGAVNPDDFFALFWAGSIEPWFMLDVIRMRDWAYRQGLLPSNQATVVYGESLGRFTPGPGTTFIDSTSGLEDLKAQTIAVIDALAQKVQARRDAGGDPLLFVFATSHGDQLGRLLIVDNLATGVGRKYWPEVFGNQKLIPADEILPIHKIPACRVRVAVSCCYAKHHILKWYFHYSAMNPPPDVQFYSSSGTRVGTGKRFLGQLWKQVFHDHVFPPDLDTLGPVGVTFSLRWADDGARFVAGGDLEFPPKTPPLSFTRYQGIGNLGKHQGATINDRICFDPGFPDPCMAPPEGPGDLVSYSDDTTTITHFHHVGIDPCPQHVHTVTVTNVTGASVTLKVTAGNHLIASAGTVTLGPGESVDVEVSFDCSTQEQFTSPVRIEATGSGETQTREIDVTVKFP